MSIELDVLSRVAANRAAVLDRLAARGWSAALLSDWPRWIPLENGPITAHEAVLGWCSRWASAPNPQLPIAQLPSSHYAMVGLSSHPPDLSWALDRAGQVPLLREHILAARHAYTVRTSAGRTDLAYALQHAVWRALGETTGGVLYHQANGDIMSHALNIGLVPEIEAPTGPEPLRGQVGMAAPDLALRARDGTTFSLRARRGSHVTLWFLAGRSADIDAQELEALAKHHDMIARRTTLVVIADSADAPATRLGSQFAVFTENQRRYQPSAASQYDAERTRLTILIDANGVICDRFERGEPSKLVFDLIKRIGTPGSGALP